MAKYQLKLYVSGTKRASRDAVDNLGAIVQSPPFFGDSEVEIVDLLEHPEVGEDDCVLGTPLLLIRSPRHTRRIFGDLSDWPRVCLEQDILSPD